MRDKIEEPDTIRNELMDSGVLQMSVREYWCPKCGTEMVKGIYKGSIEYECEVYLLTCSNCCLQGQSFDSFSQAYYDARMQVDFTKKWFPDLYDDNEFSRQYIYDDDKGIWIRTEPF